MNTKNMHPAQNPLHNNVSSRSDVRGQTLSKAIKVVLFIVMDVTGSMDPYIEGVRNALFRFLDILKKGDLDPTLGLILFRDETCGELPEVFSLGTQPDAVRDILAKTRAEGGGDDPESSLPAIMRALDALGKADQKTRRVLLHITDAGAHDPEGSCTANSVSLALLKRGAVFFACAPQEDPYLRFCNETGGMLFPMKKDMDAAMFEGVLADVARTTVATLIQPGALVSPVVLAELAAYSRKR